MRDQKQIRLARGVRVRNCLRIALADIRLGSLSESRLLVTEAEAERALSTEGRFWNAEWQN
jgi:hypothetical protein